MLAARNPPPPSKGLQRSSLTVALLQNLTLEALFLSPAHIHAQQHGSPVLGILAACPSLHNTTAGLATPLKAPNIQPSKACQKDSYSALRLQGSSNGLDIVPSTAARSRAPSLLQSS